MPSDAEAFAERFERAQRRWREYQRNRPQYDGDWAELVTDINEMMKDNDE
jgi:hypothetical protein